jgi:transposase-like protein
MLIVKCPGCKTDLQVSDDGRAGQYRCPKCGATVSSERGQAAPAVSTPPPLPQAQPIVGQLVDDDDDSRDRRRGSATKIVRVVIWSLACLLSGLGAVTLAGPPGAGGHEARLVFVVTVFAVAYSFDALLRAIDELG